MTTLFNYQFQNKQAYLSGFVNSIEEVKTKQEITKPQTLQAAFYDMETGKIYASQFANGCLAPIHIFDGLPEEIQARSDLNVISGFTQNGNFLTRKQALEIMIEQNQEKPDIDK